MRIILDTCANVTPPNVTVEYDPTALENGHFPDGTYGTVTCPQGYEQYGEKYIQCRGECWDYPIESFRYIPNEHGELNLRT